MLQLNKSKEIISSILGAQEYCAEKNYKLSNFCFAKSVDKGLLLFSNLTKELLLLDGNEYSLSDEYGYTFHDDLMEYLVTNWFLFSENADEVAICDQLRAVIRLFQTSEGINTFTILPTTGCNARCFYCFEAGAPAINMSEKTANDVVEYICKNRTAKRVSLSWFGGEPLCNIKAIDTIVNSLKRKEIDYASVMTTNGYLFDEEIAKKAKEDWKMQWVQITLDGLHETYANTKKYVNNDKNPLDKVLHNIELLLKNDIIVNTRLNLGLHNIDELKNLSNFLIERFKKYRKFILYVVPIYENEGFEKSVYSEYERLTLYNALVELTELFEKNGVSAGAPDINEFKAFSCLVDSKDKVLICPDGSLGFCEHNISTDFFGTIYNNAKKPKWCGYKKAEEKCKKCVAYPSCLLLEKCSSALHSCYKYDQYLRVKYVERAIMGVYKKYLMGLNSKC